MTDKLTACKDCQGLEPGNETIELHKWNYYDGKYDDTIVFLCAITGKPCKQINTDGHCKYFKVKGA